MIYINYDGPASPMLHTKFRGNRPTGSGEEDFLKVFAFYSDGGPFKCMSKLCWPCRTIGQGHPRVIIYIKFVELQSLMLHTKFQNHWPSGSGEEDF